MDRIRDWLWISDLETVKTQNVNHFDLIIGACQNSAQQNVQTEYQHFTLSDGPGDTGNGQHNYEYFKQIVDTIVTAIQQDKTVLVHCHVGRSRSAAICTAALGTIEQLPYMDALSEISDVRNVFPEKELADHARTYIEQQTGISHQPFETKEK